MAMFHVIKQLEEKNVASEITFMVWSDRMDLVALANAKGEVALHRLTWTKAWSVGPPKELLTVKVMTWRPDGKVLAIAYSSGEIYLMSVENKSTLNVVDTAGSDVTCINWIQEKTEVKTSEVPHFPADTEDQNDYMKYIDYSSVFLPDPPSSSSSDTLSNSSDENQKPNLLHDQTELNLLLIGTREGTVLMNVFGCFQCAQVDFNEYLGVKCSVENIHLTEDLSKMFVTVKTKDNDIKIVSLDTSLLQMYTKELFAIALKYIRLQHLIDYISTTITTITETWENILLEMDAKLSKYASKVPEGAVTADFLDLLMFGFCSLELEEFLLKDLTKKGLEKFGQTIELSYSNIQKLLLKYVIKFGQNITYHLSELRGMARFELRYEVFGLSEEVITEAIQAVGLFLIKSGEMQQIINHSITNYKAFIRWLYTEIMLLMDEQVPSEIPKMTQQDLAYSCEFLQNFDHIGQKDDGTKKGFMMERIGQYLADSPLTLPPSIEGNDWTQFLDMNHCIKNCPSILGHQKDLSLVQQYKHMKSKVLDIFTQPRIHIGTHFASLNVYNCFNINNQHLFRISQINLNKELIIYAFVHQNEYLDLLQTHENGSFARFGRFNFPQPLSYDQESNGDNYNILDIKFYTSSILSMLLQETSNMKTAVLYQFSIPVALERLREIDLKDSIVNERSASHPINGSNFNPKLFKVIDSMAASQFAVSGSRRVSIVLSENKRRVRLFEMEGDDEDDDDADMTNNSTVKENDVVMQDSSILE